jgi:hypothetical protein
MVPEQRLLRAGVVLHDLQLTVRAKTQDRAIRESGPQASFCIRTQQVIPLQYVLHREWVCVTRSSRNQSLHLTCGLVAAWRT